MLGGLSRTNKGAAQANGVQGYCSREWGAAVMAVINIQPADLESLSLCPVTGPCPANNNGCQNDTYLSENHHNQHHTCAMLPKLFKCTALASGMHTCCMYSHNNMLGCNILCTRTFFTRHCLRITSFVAAVPTLLAGVECLFAAAARPTASIVRGFISALLFRITSYTAAYQQRRTTSIRVLGKPQPQRQHYLIPEEESSSELLPLLSALCSNFQSRLLNILINCNIQL